MITRLPVKREVPLAQFMLTPIVVMVGVLPVVITPVSAFNVGVQGGVLVGVMTGVTQNATLTAGLVYANNKGSFAGRFSNRFQWSPPTLFAGLDLKGYTGAEPSDVQELFQSGLTMLFNEEGKAQKKAKQKWSTGARSMAANGSP